AFVTEFASVYSMGGVALKSVSMFTDERTPPMTGAARRKPKRESRAVACACRLLPRIVPRRWTIVLPMLEPKLCVESCTTLSAAYPYMVTSQPDADQVTPSGESALPAAASDFLVAAAGTGGAPSVSAGASVGRGAGTGAGAAGTTGTGSASA